MTGLNRLRISSIAAGGMAALAVYATYHTSDSVSVENGDALLFAAFAILVAAVGWISPAPTRPEIDTREAIVGVPKRFGFSALQSPRRFQSPGWLGVAIDGLPWALAGWIMLSAFATSPPGNLRMATNEAWVWVAGAAVFTAARRVFASDQAIRAMLTLLVLCSVVVAVHGLHQQFVSLPQSQADYEADPDAVLEMVGIVAPEGSAQRMAFENRLYDGGATGTFALANSLAAVLLVGILVPVAFLRLQWSSLSRAARWGWIGAVIIAAGCLFATRSRSALLACFAGVFLILLASSRLRTARRPLLLATWGILALVGVITGVLIAAFGNAEWFEQAPASVTVRLQYWRSTLALALDHPWFGIGPGNFQSLYERYRQPTASEQIADPHSFLFETLASGGFVALALLAALVATASFVVVRQLTVTGRAVRPVANQPEVASPANPETKSADESTAPFRCVWMGAGLGLLAIWLLGALLGQLPDVEAHMLAVPVAVLIGVAVIPSVRGLSDASVSVAAAVGLACLLTHLLVSGGWTVPGVAIHAWLLAGTLVRVPAVQAITSAAAPLPSVPGNETSRRQSLPREPSQVRRLNGHVWASLACGALLLGALSYFSVSPVQTRLAQQQIAQYAQASGQFRLARASLERAVQADPWAAEPAIWLADMHRRDLVSGDDSAALRRQWEQAVEEAKRRAGDDPSVYRVLAEQQLHVYQRLGRQEDLLAARQTIRSASQWSPSHQWIMAQRAAIAAALGDADFAREAAQRAEWLAQLGDDPQRLLERQLIYPPEPIGPAVARQPRRLPASVLLANQLSNEAVQGSDSAH